MTAECKKAGRSCPGPRSGFDVPLPRAFASVPQSPRGLRAAAPEEGKTADTAVQQTLETLVNGNKYAPLQHWHMLHQMHLGLTSMAHPQIQ